MKILFVADLGEGRTGYHRFMAARRLGHDVIGLNTTGRTPSIAAAFAAKVALRFRRHLDVISVGQQLEHLAGEHAPDVVWLDKVTVLSPVTIRRIKQRHPHLRVAFYHPDDFRSRFNWPIAYNHDPSLIDVIATTKSYNVAEYRSLGFSDVLFVNNSFEPTEHHPPEGVDPSQTRKGFDFEIGFVGGYEADRAGLIFGLAERGLEVAVAGSFWDKAGRLPPGVRLAPGDLTAPHYANRLYATKINLAFLRKQNRDLQTTRSFEIPASGGFMLSERTDELELLLRRGVEAEYFSTLDELERKCRYFLEADMERERIARAGWRKVWSGGFRSDDIVRAVLEHAVRMCP